MGRVRQGVWKWFKAFMEAPSFNPRTGMSSPGGPSAITDEDVWRERLAELKDDVRALRKRKPKGTDERPGSSS